MHLSNRRGATLPLAILVIALLSVTAIAGLSRVSSEQAVNGNLQAEADALGVAQAGLEEYMAVVTGIPAVSLDTTITGLPGGTAAIQVRRLRAAAGGLPALYVIRSHGSSTGSKRSDHRTPTAERSVAQFAVWRPGTMQVLGAWTSITGLDKNGGSGTISGTDQCGVATAVAGVAVPTTAADGGAGYDQNGGSSVPSGTPNITYPAADAGAFAPLVPVDWDGIVNHNALTANYNLTGTSGWPTTFTSWPIIMVTAASVTLGPGQSGQGLIVVTGNITLNGSFSWDGVILAGGVITSNGNQTIQGAIMSGLNVQLGQTVATSDVGNGNKTVRYNSCNVSSALQNLGSLQAIPNAWADNWSTW